MNQKLAVIVNDSPLVSLAHDELERASFASYVASLIAESTSESSISISINGAWGSGKTTLANFIRQKLVTRVNQPIIVNFNPWLWAGREAMIESLFSCISHALETTSSSYLRATSPEAKKSSKILKSLQREIVYLKALFECGHAVDTEISRVCLSTIGVGFSGFGIGIAAGGGTAAGLAVSAVSVTAACTLGIFPRILGSLHSAIEARRLRNERSLEELKDSISSKLRELSCFGCRLVVFIDDLDRLDAEEIPIFLQLVRSCLDFPNLVIVVLFDKQRVAEALGNNVVRGLEYQKKIFQVELDLPAPPRERLLSSLELHAREIYKEHCTVGWDPERYRKLFLECIWPSISTIRDIKKLGTMFEIAAETRRRNGIVEVNPVDLLVLESLRLLYPQVYQKLQVVLREESHKRSWYSKDEDPEKRVRELFPDLEDSAEGDRLRRLLRRLLLETSYSFETAEKEVWISESRYFKRYFGAAFSNDDIPSVLIREVVSSKDAELSLNRILNLTERYPIPSVLNELAIRTEDFPKEGIPDMVITLSVLAELLPLPPTGVSFSSDYVSVLENICLRLIQRFQSHKLYVELLESILAHPKTRVLGIVMARRVYSKKALLDEGDLIPDDLLERLRSVSANKLNKIFADVSILDYVFFDYLYYALAEFGCHERRNWIFDICKNDSRYLLKFVARMLGESSSSNSGFRYKLNLTEVEDLVIEQYMSGSLEVASKAKEISDLEKHAYSLIREKYQWPN